MAAPVLVPCLVALRGEYNRASPGRDRRSDGWIGDKAHRLRPSDHNPDETGKTPYSDADMVDEVHGLDVDETGPWPAPGWFNDSVEVIRLRHQSGRDDRLQNIIWRGRIASRTWGWGWRDYDGENGHYEHAHFSSRYETQRERDTRPWLPQEAPVTTPTSDWAHDIDPSAATYSAGGALWTILGRTSALNTMPTAIAQLKARLDDLVADDESDLDALAATLALIGAQLSLLLADPAEVGEAHPIVAAVRYAIANPAEVTGDGDDDLARAEGRAQALMPGTA